MYRHVKSKRGKQLLIGFGVVGATVGSVVMRLYLMKHSGFSGNDEHSKRLGMHECLVEQTRSGI